MSLGVSDDATWRTSERWVSPDRGSDHRVDALSYITVRLWNFDHSRAQMTPGDDFAGREWLMQAGR
jgi:hypothetical protein